VLHAWKRTADRMSSERDAYDDVQRLLVRLGEPAVDRRR
jgi:hypothetical protein